MPVFLDGHKVIVHPDRIDGAYEGRFLRSHFNTRASEAFVLVEASEGVLIDMLGDRTFISRENRTTEIGALEEPGIF